MPKPQQVEVGHPEHNLRSDGAVRRLSDGREEAMLSPRRRGESHASFILRLPPAPGVPGKSGCSQQYVFSYPFANVFDL